MAKLFLKFVISIATWVLCINITSGQNSENTKLFLKRADSLESAGSFAEAESILHQIINESSYNSTDRGMAYRELAGICASHTRKHEEIRYLFDSYFAFRNAGDRSQVAEALRLIGHYYFYMKLFAQAEPYLNEAHEIAVEQRDTIIQIKALSNLAQLAGSKGQLEATTSLYQTAIHLSKLKNYHKGLYENWNRISYTYQKLGKPEEMLGAMRQALKYVGSNKDTLGILYGDLGYAFMENHHYDSAEFALQAALKYINEGRNNIQKFLIIKIIADLKKLQGNYPEAILLLQQYDSLRTMVFTEQLRAEVGYAESRYNQLAMESQLNDSHFRAKTLGAIAIIGFTAVTVLIFIVFALRKSVRERRKQKEELDIALASLEQRESFLEQLFENSPSMIITHDLDGFIYSTNDMVIKVLGKSFNNKYMIDIILPAYKKQFGVFVEDLKMRGASSGWFRMLDKDGSLRIFRYQSKVLESAGEKPTAITYALDDSEIFKARLDVELERQRLLSIMQNSPDVYAIFREDSTIDFMNHPTFFDGKDATGNKVLNYVPEDVGVRFMSNLAKVYTDRQAIEFEESYNGGIYLVKLIPVLSKSVVKEVLGIGTDITEKRQQEDREKELNLLIERNEKRYRSLVEASQVLICSHDLKGTLLTVNLPGAYSMGYQPNELVGHGLGEFIPEEFQAELQEYMRIVTTTGLFEGFLSVNRKDGTRRIFLCRNILLREENIVLGSAQDVTEWKKAEFRERQIRKELELAKEEAEESNRLKTIFLGSLSHEVRTPLQGILGFAEILDSPAITEAKRKEYLNIIKRRTHDMQNIIESLLDIASVETGELRAIPVEMNLYEYAELIFSRTGQDYPALKNVHFLFESHLPPNSMAFIDAQHLNQVLINLIRNAVKFTNEGFIKVVFERFQGHYRISVIDTGIGIAKDKLSQIFMPFRQAHEGISRSKGGIGLGLAISKKMVELWNGQISVESELGKGSTFTITIPTEFIYPPR